VQKLHKNLLKICIVVVIISPPKKYAKVEAEKAAIQLCKSVNAYQVKIFDYKTFKHKYDSAHINYIVEVTAMCIF
jgi:hypothetical protein